MLSAIARSPVGQDLLHFMEENQIEPDWDLNGKQIKAYVTGRDLDQKTGSSEIDDRNRVNSELLLHLESDASKVVVNLNTLLALGAGFVNQQYKMARTVYN